MGLPAYREEESTVTVLGKEDRGKCMGKTNICACNMRSASSKQAAVFGWWLLAVTFSLSMSVLPGLSCFNYIPRIHNVLLYLTNVSVHIRGEKLHCFQINTFSALGVCSFFESELSS